MRLHKFWQRVTEGLELTQLWSQFESEARTSYRLYSRDVAAKTPEGFIKRHRLRVVKEFFWAVLEKLSPARRVLLLMALIMLVIPQGKLDLHFWAGLLL
ncbi:MAG: serine/threonine protein phosphatase, partial [Candidatus Sulfotelmatobacter sp.]